MDDIFCKIIAGEIKSDVVMETDEWLAINDIHPQAPVHVLIIPKRHINDLQALEASDAQLMGTLMLAVKQVAQKLNLDYKGYRLIINQGEDGGQLVPHLHMHLLGGKHLGPKIVRD